MTAGESALQQLTAGESAIQQLTADESALQQLTAGEFAVQCCEPTFLVGSTIFYTRSQIYFLVLIYCKVAINTYVKHYLLYSTFLKLNPVIVKEKKQVNQKEA